ncbi:hypothetical protein QA597_09485 [Marinilabiliaceae bacterium ANBcel2]|nr:hypothetical protein [Marinilabiliaceae bacterium ANBcel2]
MKKRLLLLSMVLAFCFSSQAVSLMPELSSGDDEIWYFIEFSNGGYVISDQGIGNNLLTAEKSVVATQLWKFEETEEDSEVYIVTSMMGNFIGFYNDRYIATEDDGTELLIHESDSEDYPSSFEIKRAENEDDFYMNQFGGAGVDNQLGEWFYGDMNNPVIFIKATQEQIDEASDNTVNYLKNELSNKLNFVQDEFSSVDEGDEVGEYSTDAVNNLESVLQSVQDVIDSEDSTPNDFYYADSELDQAIVEFLNSVNKPFKVSIPGEKEYYYVIYTPNRNNSALAVDEDAEGLTSVDYSNTDDFDETLPANQKWIFIELTDGSYAIVNPTTINSNLTEDVYIDPKMVDVNEQILLTNTPVESDAWEFHVTLSSDHFAILQDDYKMQFSVANNNDYVINWGYDMTLYGGTLNLAGYLLDDDGVMFSIKQVDSGEFTSIYEVEDVQYSIYVQNRVVKVDGAEEFEVYSLTGTLVDHRYAVPPGIYIVKIGDHVDKILVR